MNFNILSENYKGKPFSRKIIQIEATNGFRLFALCDDGTVWMSDHSREWKLYRHIPQQQIMLSEKVEE
jgi:hypothetical protein